MRRAYIHFGSTGIPHFCTITADIHSGQLRATLLEGESARDVLGVQVRLRTALYD
jgi:hypothetical protein